MEIVLYIVLILVGIILIFLKQKIFSLIILVLGATLLITSIVNFCTNVHQLTLSNQLLDEVSKINWSDEKELEKLGFQKQGAEYVLYFDNSPNTLVVSSEFDMPESVVKYKNILYHAEEMTMGKLDIRRLLYKKIYAYRNYTFIIDNVKIYSYEDTFEGEKLSIENIIHSLNPD